MESETGGGGTTTPFARAMLNVMTGTAGVESLSKSLVTGAVRECIERVSLEYGLDVREVSEMFEEDIVRRHSAMSVSQSAGEGLLCSATTRAGKPCPRLRKFGNFCTVHSNGSKVDETKRRRIQAYAVSLVEKENQEPNSKKKRQQKSKVPVPAPVPVVDTESELLMLL